MPLPDPSFFELTISASPDRPQRIALAAVGITAIQEEQKSRFLPKMVTGEWTGTMNLTEPQAGSDLSAVRTRAVPASADHYLLSGQKIYITYGEHDLAENIIHLVLARTPDAPEGVKGISLFIVPKFIPDSNTQKFKTQF